MVLSEGSDGISQKFQANTPSLKPSLVSHFWESFKSKWRVAAPRSVLAPVPTGTLLYRTFCFAFRQKLPTAIKQEKCLCSFSSGTPMSEALPVIVQMWSLVSFRVCLINLVGFLQHRWPYDCMPLIWPDTFSSRVATVSFAASPKSLELTGIRWERNLLMLVYVLFHPFSYGFLLWRQWLKSGMIQMYCHD